jgi:hypothetical protein
VILLNEEAPKNTQFCECAGASGPALLWCSE